MAISGFQATKLETWLSRRTFSSNEERPEFRRKRDCKLLLTAVAWVLPLSIYWEKLNPGVSKPGCFPLFSGKVQIVSRTLSGLFLVGALNRPRKRKRTNRENPRTIPEQIGKIPEKSGKSQKGQKRTKKEGQVQIGKPPRLKPPRLAALEYMVLLSDFFSSYPHNQIWNMAGTLECSRTTSETPWFVWTFLTSLF